MAIRFSSSSLLNSPPPFVSRRFSTPVSLSLLPSPLIFLKRLPSSLPHSTSMKGIYMVASEENPSLVAASPTPIQKKREYSLKKKQIVRVDKEKYLKSINYLSVGHPPYYKGLDYIYEDRGEVLDIRIFETGEYALIAWIGIPTSPAWLPTDMLIKSDKSSYKRT